jgi:protein required for attachment to host cells
VGAIQSLRQFPDIRADATRKPTFAAPMRCTHTQMEDAMKPIITWVVVADGAEARVLENRGPGKGLVPVKGLHFSQPRLRAQDIVTDRPGRSFSSVGHGRSAVEPHTDPVAYLEHGFAKRVAEALKAAHSEGAFDRLIIAAEPVSLGNLREVLCDAVDKTVMAELPKDLTKVPLADLPRHFEDILAV